MNLSKNNNKLKISALHKSGTMFLFKYFKEIAILRNIAYFSENNPKPNNDNYSNADIGILCPLRILELPTKNENVIIQLRDPLDTLVSQYYSFAFMHELEDEQKQIGYWPGQVSRKKIQALGINEYCLEEANDLKNRLSKLKELVGRRDVLVLSYFNMVYDFKSWNQKVNDYLNNSQTHREELFHKFKNEFEGIAELMPNQIRSGLTKHHKRKLYPGDAYFKLDYETILKLKTVFKEEIEISKNLRTKTSIANHADKQSKDINKLCFPNEFMRRAKEKAAARIISIKIDNRNKERLIVNGWAFLKPTLIKASSVYLIINNKKVPVSYGSPSEFLVNKYGSNELGNCRFKISLLKKKINLKKNELRVRVEDENSGLFYISRKYFLVINKDNLDLQLAK